MKYIENNNRIFVEDNNKVVAEINYEKIDDNTYNIYHTFVDESLRGQGIANTLVSKAVEHIEKDNCNVEATCSYAKHWLEKNRRV